MIKNDFSITESMIMIKIYKMNPINPTQMTISKIAEAVEVSVSNVRLWSVMKYLTEVEAITQVEQIGSCKILKINKDILEKVIMEQKVLIPIFKFYEDQHTIVF